MAQAVRAFRAAKASRTERRAVPGLFCSSLEQVDWQRLKLRASTIPSALRPRIFAAAAVAP